MLVPIKYFVKRLVTYFLTLIAAFTIVFIIPRLVPGNPIRTILMQLSLQGQNIPGGEEIVKAYKKMFGLEGDLFTQYLSYLSQVLRGNLGISISFFPTPVKDLIARAIPWTIGLLSLVVVISWVIGNILGALIGWSRPSKVTIFIAYVGLTLSCIPYYVLALILILIFAYYIPLFPTSGAMPMGATPRFTFDFIFNIIRYGTLPALSIILSSLGGWLISMRSLIINIQGEDFIMFAEAKGLRRSTILMKYALRNALLPQATGLALSLGYTVSGSLLVESIFAYPGLGNLYMTALELNDYNLIQGLTLLVIFTVLTANFLIDLLYPLIDPRISYEKK